MGRKNGQEPDFVLQRLTVSSMADMLVGMIRRGLGNDTFVVRHNKREYDVLKMSVDIQRGVVVIISVEDTVRLDAPAPNHEG